MRRSNRWGWLAVLALGCSHGWPLQTQQARPVIPFVPHADWEWPLAPTADGWLVGGSGYRSGAADPTGLRPGLGLGAVLIPSVQAGRLLGFPGPPLTPHRFVAPFVSWQLPAPSIRPSVSPSPPVSPQPASPLPPQPRPTPIDLTGPLTGAMTKAGPALVGVPETLPFPKSAWTWSPWGPVALQPGPLPSGVPLLDLGFPPADGTPAHLTFGIPWFVLRGSTVEVVILDLISRTLHRPPSLQRRGFQIITDLAAPVALVGPLRGIGRAYILDLLTGSYDPLPELPDIDASTFISGASMTQSGAVIAFSTLEGDRLRVHLFDRRSRRIFRLDHLNRAGSTSDPAIDLFGNFVLVTVAKGGHNDVHLFSVQTGLVDTLPAVNSPANEQAEDLSVDARLLAYITDETGTPEARIYDRRTGSIDTLPEVNSLGPVIHLHLAKDGSLLALSYVAAGQLRIALYNRLTGQLDPLPELNPPGINAIP